MNKFTKGFLFLLFIAVSITGCKLDPPIYPEGAGSGTVTYTINGTTTTKHNVSFVMTAASGTTTPASIYMGNDTDFGLAFDGSSKGTFDIGILVIGDALGTGTVTVTTYDLTDSTHGTLKGTFTADLYDSTTNTTTSNVTGTFDIQQ
ncbi:hypothetical protein [Mucilaginibacter segetis]|uniref:Uncharacterized protein n=1 Tax=Mucilaginibacter segetis TaxID=2793071 RepID=A0A934UKR0_9SPHI|nr:hypothetical protein [Mucilaginibacter segetis]MBK0377723.1 hypothetical protein [Mucilaginibacter segetis]